MAYKPKEKVVDIKLPQAFDFLRDKSQEWRYRVCYGGRGKGATWSYCRALIARAIEKKIRILCCREFQNSIDDSTYSVLKDQIELLELTKLFKFTGKSIECFNGSNFIFKGLARNIDSVKSTEGIDIVDVEEAQKLSEESMNILFPTVRRDNSEIWIRFNTGYADDPVYERFVTNPCDNAIVRKINFEQNPHFPKVLQHELDEDRKYRPSVVANKWYGEPLATGRKVWPDFINKSWPQGHVRAFDWNYVKELGNCYMAMDPAQHYLPFCLWVAIIPKTEGKGFYKWIYNEWPNREYAGDDFHKIRKTLTYTGTTLELSKQFYIAGGTAEHGLTIRKRFIDTRFATGSGSGSFFSGETTGIVSSFAQKDNGGLIFDSPSVKMIDAARDQIHKDFEVSNLSAMSAFNEPGLYVAPWCLNLIQSLNNHRLEEGKEKEAEKYKDASDTLRILYAGIADQVWEDPRPPEPEEREYYGQSSNSSWMGH